MTELAQDQWPEVARAALKRVLASPDFGATDRIRRFLVYVVEETLAGRSDRIKAYSIATSVFGRDDSFDPQVDSIVRIEAGRLRRTLEHYYLTGGQSDPLQLRIPKGSYVPVFVAAKIELPKVQPTAGEEPVRSGKRGPSVLVGPFEEEGDHSGYPHFACGFTRSLTIDLTRFPGLRVFSSEAALARVEADACQTDYVVRGATVICGDRFRVEVLLVEARTGMTIWADTFERTLVPAEIYSLRSEVANRVAQIIAQPYGIIYTDKARDCDGTPPERLTSFNCVMCFYNYWRTFDRNLFEPVRKCLERTIEEEPDYGEAFACLSLVYSNAYRFGDPLAATGTDPRQRAMKLANRAIELAPSSSWSHYALSMAYWFVNDVAASIAALETARSLNPNDTTIMADLGQRYAMLTEWNKAVPLLEGSFALSPAQPGSYRIGLFLFHVAHGRYEEAWKEAWKIDAPHVVYGHIAVAVSAAQLGCHQEAASAVKRILAIDPAYGDCVVSDLERRNLHPDLIAVVIAGLRKAGLPGRDTEIPDVAAARQMRRAAPAESKSRMIATNRKLRRQTTVSTRRG